MSCHRDRTAFRLALIGALMVSLGLAACGRKGPLDPPPASRATGQNAAPSGSLAAKTKGTLGRTGLSQVPKGSDRHIPLDVLLN